MTAKCDFLSKRAIYRIAFFLSFWSVWSLTICNSFYLIWKYEKRFIEEKNFSKNFIKKGVTQSNQLQGLPKVLCFCSCDQVQKFFFYLIWIYLWSKVQPYKIVSNLLWDGLYRTWLYIFSYQTFNNMNIFFIFWFRDVNLLRFLRCLTLLFWFVIPRQHLK